MAASNGAILFTTYAACKQYMPPLIAATIASSATVCLLHPIENLHHLNQQMRHASISQTIHYLQQQQHAPNMRKLLVQHMGSSLLSVVPLRALIFACFEYLHKQRDEWYEAALHGGVAGATAALITHPLDTMVNMAKQQDTVNGKTVMERFAALWQRYGLGGYLRGVVHRTLHISVHSSAVFLIFEGMYKMVHNSDGVEKQ